MSSRLVLRLCALLVCLCVAVPATALVVRVTVYFSASFDGSGSPGSGISVDVGSAALSGPTGVFTVVAGPGGGQLRVADAGLASDAALEAKLKQLYKGSDVSIEFTLTCSQNTSDLVLRAEDDADSGLIDLEFGGGGGIGVDGLPTGKSYTPGVTYAGELRLKDSLVGDSTWSLMLKGGPSEVIFVQGTMKSDAPLRLEDIQLIRPAGGTPGEFFLDDIRVSSTSYLPVY